MTNFIETYKTDKSLCDDLIKFYHLNKHKHLEGTVGDKVQHHALPLHCLEELKGPL